MLNVNTVKDYFYIQNFLHGNFIILKFLYMKISKSMVSHYYSECTCNIP